MKSDLTTFKQILSAHPDAALAIGAHDRPWLTYGDLRALSQNTDQFLRENGFSTSSRIAIVLPNGPEMAAAFATLCQSVTTAPLNPAYKEEEFRFYLEDLNADALLVASDYEGPAVAAAKSLGVAVLRLAPSEKAGNFTLSGDGRDAAPALEPGETDVALILHTSGTTSRPKIVPLTQGNVVASASHIAASLQLSASDRCLNVMPLFHIHGLIAAVSASLYAGAQIWCSSGFDALKFYGWMEEATPTWYTAVPTMHQAILSRASRNEDKIKANPLRFIRSSSASLPPQVFAELAAIFSAPVIESYGMTEAAHQMACNPLPPRAQKPGSVGVEAGPKVRIAHEIENHLVKGLGEIVISGPNVTHGYESNPEANEKSFFEAEDARWFRTGDQGQFDDGGYLSLTGRLKEIINRGGEKISPLEVDEVLLDHPDVVQVVAFAVPHPKLGEEVGAAIVLSEGSGATADTVRAFAAERMAAFKVPRHVIVMDEIPKGATGKMQRIGLAEKLGLA